MTWHKHNMQYVWTGTKRYYNSIAIKFHRKGIELLLEKKKNNNSRNSSLNSEESVNYIQLYLVILCNLYYYQVIVVMDLIYCWLFLSVTRIFEKRLCECPVNLMLYPVIRTPLLDRMAVQFQFTFQNTECLYYPLPQRYSYRLYIDNYQVVNCSVAEHHAYRITGHFCDCLISLVFCSQNIMQDKL